MKTKKEVLKEAEERTEREIVEAEYNHDGFMKGYFIFILIVTLISACIMVFNQSTGQ